MFSCNNIMWKLTVTHIFLCQFTTIVGRQGKGNSSGSVGYECGLWHGRSCYPPGATALQIWIRRCRLEMVPLLSHGSHAACSVRWCDVVCGLGFLWCSSRQCFGTSPLPCLFNRCHSHIGQAWLFCACIRWWHAVVWSCWSAWLCFSYRASIYMCWRDKWMDGFKSAESDENWDNLARIHSSNCQLSCWSSRHSRSDDRAVQVDSWSGGDGGWRSDINCTCQPSLQLVFLSATSTARHPSFSVDRHRSRSGPCTRS